MEELSLTLPEGVELQPVGTVSSIIQQLGKHACQSWTGLGRSLSSVGTRALCQWRLSESGMFSVAFQLSSSH